MKNKKNLFYLILIIFVYLLIVCISNCTYNIHGDSIVYMKWLAYLKSGDYFTQNWNALLGAGKHLCLTTEGGYIFLLWFASLINGKLPFFLSTFFVSGFTILLLTLVMILETRKRAILTGLITIILIFSYYKIGKEFMMLNTCLRDGSAHFFGILGVLLSCVGVRKNYAKRYMFTGCLFIGIGAWCRIPNILFIIPAVTYFLLNTKRKQFKKKFSISLIMFLGLIIGLLPLLSQNIFEGKDIYRPGQASSLIYEKKPIIKEKNNIISYSVTKILAKHAYHERFKGEEKGLSLKNFLTISKRTYIKLCSFFGKPNIYLWSFIIILSVILNYRLSLTMLSGFFSFYLFYSCYDKVINRYILISLLMLLPLIAIVISEFLFIILNSKLLKKHYKHSYQCLLIIILLLLVFQINKYNQGTSQIKNSHRLFMKCKEDLEQLKLNKNDEFICVDKSYRVWTQYFYKSKSFRWQWSISPHFSVLPNNMQLLPKIRDYMTNDKRIFLFEIQGGEYPYKYWSKLDINTYYDLKEKLKIYNATPNEENIVIYQLTPKSTEKKVIKVDVSAGNTNLFIWTADASNLVPTNQTVIISSKNGSITNDLYLGFNIYSLPNNFLENDNCITINSGTNLPAIVETSLFNTNFTCDLRKYENISGVTRTFVTSTPVWLDNRYSWAREIKPPKADYRQPIIALNDNVIFNLNNEVNSNLDLILNISTSAQARTITIKQFLVQNINLECNKNNIMPKIKLRKRTRKHSERYVNADLNITNLTSNTNHIIDADFKICLTQLPIFLNSITITYK